MAWQGTLNSASVASRHSWSDSSAEPEPTGKVDKTADSGPCITPVSFRSTVGDDGARLPHLQLRHEAQGPALVGASSHVMRPSSCGPSWPAVSLHRVAPATRSTVAASH